MVGGGGLSHGLSQNKAIKVKYAVEYSPSSTMTYQYDFPFMI